MNFDSLEINKLQPEKPCLNETGRVKNKKEAISDLFFLIWLPLLTEAAAGTKDLKQKSLRNLYHLLRYLHLGEKLESKKKEFLHHQMVELRFG